MGGQWEGGDLWERMRLGLTDAVCSKLLKLLELKKKNHTSGYVNVHAIYAFSYNFKPIFN